ncbi:MAG: hypothetical protein KA791_12485, partial [Flavobacteriales bacterium]|nr:hypothetical protein [Flavobacteriales bacterium]
MSGVRFYKGAICVTFAALSFACIPAVSAQQSGASHRIRAIVQDVRNARQAHDVDVALRVFPGVLMSRTDFNTRNVLMEVTADCAIDREQMRTILQPYGLSVSCWSRAIQSDHDFEPLD